MEETAIGVGWQTQNRQRVMEAATISYTLWRNPADRDDPINLAELSATLQAELDTQPPWRLPDWILRARERMRYPWLWDAVRTTHISDRSAVAWHTPEFALVEHVNSIVMNTFREERVRGGLPGELLSRVTEKAIEHAIPVAIDGADLPGIRIDTDEVPRRRRARRCTHSSRRRPSSPQSQASMASYTCCSET